MNRRLEWNNRLWSVLSSSTNWLEFDWWFASSEACEMEVPKGMNNMLATRLVACVVAAEIKSDAYCCTATWLDWRLMNQFAFQSSHNNRLMLTLAWKSPHLTFCVPINLRKIAPRICQQIEFSWSNNTINDMTLEINLQQIHFASTYERVRWLLIAHERTAVGSGAAKRIKNKYHWSELKVKKWNLSIFCVRTPSNKSFIFIFGFRKKTLNWNWKSFRIFFSCFRTQLELISKVRELNFGRKFFRCRRLHVTAR